MITTEHIRALSWRQPFASLMLPPFNKIETRTWNTNIRGLILICASRVGYPWNAVRDISGEKQFNRILEICNYMDQPDGHAIGIGRLVDSRPMRKSDEDQCYVEYYGDLWCHVYEDVHRIEPIPFKGGQGFRNVSAEIIDKIKLLDK